ncbi:unnamed protein product, partial [Ectocarpus sp. 12 AP-2014]
LARAAPGASSVVTRGRRRRTAWGLLRGVVTVAMVVVNRVTVRRWCCLLFVLLVVPLLKLFSYKSLLRRLLRDSTATFRCVAKNLETKTVAHAQFASTPTPSSPQTGGVSSILGFVR